MAGYVFLAPSLLLFAMFLFDPLVQSIYLSFHLTDPRGRIAAFVGLDNFTRLFASSAFWNSLAVTLMTLDSTGSLRGIVDGANGKFEVGTAFLPKPDGAPEGGVIVGGASLWILNNKPDDEQKAAWTFIRYLAEPKTQAQWHISSGYFPINKKAYEEQNVKINLVKYPQFQTAIDQLHATKLTPATQGAVMGVFPEARQIVEGAMEEAFSGAKETKKALDDAAKAITDKIATYNRTVK